MAIGNSSLLATRRRNLQRIHHISLEINLILDTAADTHKVIIHTSSLALIAGNTSVRHSARHLNKRLNTTQRLSKREDLGLLAEALSSLVSTLDAERKHTAAHAVAVLLQRDVVLLVALEAGVVDADDMLRLLESVGDGARVLGCLAGAQVQRLQAAVGEPAVEGRGHGADGVLQEAEALVELGGVVGAGAHDDVRVAVDVLGNRVDDDVGAVVERVLHVGGEERVVDDDEDAVFVGDGGDGADVDEGERGVRGRLDPDELRLRADQRLDVDLDRGREGHADVVRGRDAGEVAVSAAVDIADGDDMGADGEGLEDDGRGGRAGAEGERIAAVLEGGDGLLEVVPEARISMLNAANLRFSRTCWGWRNGSTRKCQQAFQRWSERRWWRARSAHISIRRSSLDSQKKHTGSMTAPVTGSCSAPACTARVPNLCTGEGARGGVSIGCSGSVMMAVVEKRLGRKNGVSRNLNRRRTGLEAEEKEDGCRAKATAVEGPSIIAVLGSEAGRAIPLVVERILDPREEHGQAWKICICSKTSLARFSAF